MACLWLLAIGVLSLSLESQCNDVDNKYYNYTLLRIFPTTEEQLQAIHGFDDPDERVEVLKRSYGLNDSLDVLVPPEKMNYVQNFSQDMVAEEKHNYGRRLIPPERKERRSHSERSPLRYMSYADMSAFIDEVAARHRDLVQIERLGKSYEGREMRLIKISSDPNAQNPIIFIDAGIHSREWVAPNMALYMIDRLTSDHNAKYYDLNGLDWYILPLTNPDGYEFSRSSPSNRMWRKTRSRSTSACYGVDGNRNFGFKWAVSGVSRNPCHKETYAGSQPFSEPETRIVRDVMMRYKDRMKLYTSLHSYGNYLVYPWGYTGNLLPKSWRKLDRMAHLASDAVVRAGGKPFKVLSAGKWYAAAGGSDDFAFGAAGVPYSYTMELTEGHEFNFPEHLLPSTLPQFYPGFRAMGEQIRLEYVDVDISYASMCGCKALRPCYKEMVETLKYKNEESCIEDAAIGVSTLLIYLKALKQFCGDIVKVNSDSLTFQEKSLYEVVLTLPSANGKAEEAPRVKRTEDDAKPVILIEAGQLAGTESVGLALYVIQQLSACEEYKEMLQKVRWVILPCTNPDGMEYARFNRMSWKKNTRVNEGFSFGVDISRNFDAHWDSCTKIESGFSDIYPGETSSSENETMFIKNVLSRYKDDLKGYLSIRKDGHAILYPNGYAKAEHSNLHQLKAIASEITAKVNQRAGSVQLFMNDSIFNANGMPHCGHSVDFASEEGVSLAYEMRVFLGSDNRIISKFHSLPRGYEGSLRSGYFSGIREFYNAITNEKRFGRIV